MLVYILSRNENLYSTKRLYEEAKEHFFDVPVANDMRKFIAGYLGKGGDA